MENGKGLGVITGELHLFNATIAAMINDDTDRIPSLELVSTSLFLMSDVDRAAFIFQSALSIQSDNVQVSTVFTAFKRLRIEPIFSRTAGGGVAGINDVHDGVGDV